MLFDIYCHKHDGTCYTTTHNLVEYFHFYHVTIYENSTKVNTRDTIPMSYIFIIVIATIQLLLVLVHVVLFKTIEHIFLPTDHITLIIKIIGSIAAISFVAASLIAFYYNTLVTRIIYTTASVWLGIVLYALMASALYWGILFLAPGLQPHQKTIGMVLLIGAVGISVYGFINAQTIRITQIKIPLPSLPAAWQGKKAVWISDIHLGQVHGREFADTIVKKIQTLQPDIVFIGGDLYDGVTVQEHHVIEPFAQLHAPWGVYFITGNHEEFRDPEPYLKAIRAAGIRILSNEMVNVAGVQIIGVDYRNTDTNKKFKEVLTHLAYDPHQPNILLKHVPLELRTAQEAGFNVQLSGHTHRAQVFPFNLLTAALYHRFDYGLHRHGPMWVYTSDGVGTWGPPMRIGSGAEIVLITFVQA